MPNGVSGDWETMLSRSYIFLTIGRQLAKGGDDGSRSRSGWYTGGAISNCSARRGHLLDSASCHSATRGDWRIPHAGAGTGHSQRQPGPAFGATSKRDPPVQAHLSSVPATPEWRGAGTGDVPYQGPGSDHIRDRYANTSAALVMWIAMIGHIWMAYDRPGGPTGSLRGTCWPATTDVSYAAGSATCLVRPPRAGTVRPPHRPQR